jgi:hypothetical protein
MSSFTLSYRYEFDKTVAKIDEIPKNCVNVPDRKLVDSMSGLSAGYMKGKSMGEPNGRR